uniref:Uncharacterized protein n=1 Tax=Meloidogyne floridensis TaxID=298350 RepID=A0A915NL16_9BILA
MFGSAEKKFKDEKKIVIQQQKANAEKAAELEKQEADLKAEKEKLKKNKKQTSSYVHYQPNSVYLTNGEFLNLLL